MSLPVPEVMVCSNGQLFEVVNVAAMDEELRGEFHRELEEMDISVAALLGLLPEAIRTATDALLVNSGDLAAKIREWGALVEGLFGGVSETVESIVARQAPVARDLRFLLACVRLVPTLYDAVELVADIAAPGAAGIAMAAHEQTSALISEVGARAALTWTAVETLWSEPGGGGQAAVHLRSAQSAEACAALSGQLTAGDLDPSAVAGLAVVVRSFQWLGRHANTSAVVISHLGPRRSNA